MLIYGANRDDLSLLFTTLWLVALPLILTREWARKSIEHTPLRWIGGLFGAVILTGVLSLTPLFEPHPIWSLVPGAIQTVTIDPYETWLALIKLFGLAAAFLVGAGFGGDDERAKRLLQGLLLGGLAYGVWSFLNFEMDRATLFGSPRLLNPNRLSGSLSSPNIAATLFGSLALLNMADLMRRLERDRSSGPFRWRHLERVAQTIAVPLVGMSVSFACLVLTISRSGLVATLACVAVFLGTRAILNAKKAALAAPLIGTVVAVLGLTIGFAALNLVALGDRVADFNTDAHTRDVIFSEHWTAFLASPWQGYGLGTFPHINSMYMNDSNRSELYGIGATHNVYIQWLEEAGLAGALPMFATILFIATRIARGVVVRQRSRLWLLGILCVLAIFLIHGATDFPFEVPSMSLFLSLLLGLGYRMAKR